MEHLTKVNEKQHAAEVGSVRRKLAVCMVDNQWYHTSKADTVNCDKAEEAASRSIEC